MRKLSHSRFALSSVLSSALETLRKNINLAFVYGSVARSGEKLGSDVDLMVVGKVDFGSVVSKLAGAQKALNREINPTVYSAKRVSVETPRQFLEERAGREETLHHRR